MRCRRLPSDAAKVPSNEVLAHGEARQDAAALRHVADAGLGPLVRWATLAMSTPSRRMRPGDAVHQAQMAAQQRGLADAVAAEHGRGTRLADLKDDVLQRAAVAVEGVDVAASSSMANASASRDRRRLTSGLPSISARSALGQQLALMHDRDHVGDLARRSPCRARRRSGCGGP